MTDELYRGVVDPLGALRRTFRRERRWGNLITGSVISAGGVAGLVLGGVGAPLLLGGAGLAAAELTARRQFRGQVDLHAGGLRLRLDSETSIPWPEITALRIGFTSDQPPASRRAGIALDCDGERGFDLPPYLTQLDELLREIEAAITPVVLARTEALLDGGGALAYGRYALDAAGLLAKDRELLWSRIGPARRVRGCVVLETAIGPFEVAIGAVPNPAVLCAIVDARGRR